MTELFFYGSDRKTPEEVVTRAMKAYGFQVTPKSLKVNGYDGAVATGTKNHRSTRIAAWEADELGPHLGHHLHEVDTQTVLPVLVAGDK